MSINIEPVDRNQRTAFQEREALRQKVNEIIEQIGPAIDIQWDETPTAGHGPGYAVTSQGIKSTADGLASGIQNEAAARVESDNTLSGRIDGKQDTLTAGPGITITDNVISANGQGVEVDLSSDSFDGFKGILDNNTTFNGLYSVILSFTIQTVDRQINVNVTGSIRCGMDNPRSYSLMLGGTVALSNQGITLTYPASGIRITQDGFTIGYIENDSITNYVINKTDMLSFTPATTGFNVIFR